MKNVSAHHHDETDMGELRRGKEVTEMWQLRPYEIRPRTMWIGESAAKAYLKEDLDEVFRQYNFAVTGQGTDGGAGERGEGLGEGQK